MYSHPITADLVEWLVKEKPTRPYVACFMHLTYTINQDRIKDGIEPFTPYQIHQLSQLATSEYREFKELAHGNPR